MTNPKREGTVVQPCGYQMDRGPCGAPVIPDDTSYSGYRHLYPADWLHWASPKRYEGNAGSIFVPCAACGKKGSKNWDHVLFNGHKFHARIFGERKRKQKEAAR